MIKRLTFILYLSILTLTTYAQTSITEIEGKVTFTTSQNIYVKFVSTADISTGDTLKIADNGVLHPCLVVKKKSSSSCVCIAIDDCIPRKEDLVIFEKIVTVQPEIEKKEIIDLEKELKSEREDSIKASEKPVAEKRKERIRGRLSTAGYSSWPSARSASHRMLYRFSMNATNIKESRWSAESYINFRQNFNSDRPNLNTLRVYNLAAKYDIDSSWTVTIGRKINNKASSLGAIDGIQSEKYLGNYFVGAIVGFRPDLIEFDFNPNLLEYGAYGGYSTNTKKIYSQSTLGLLEQRNLGQVDRRYTYFQHSSTINRKLNLFVSMELDLYNKINDEVHMDLRLTNLYVSARYRFNRAINLTVSYDSRKRIIFYETLRTEIERLLADDEARQGIRFRLNVKPFKYVNAGVAYNRRFQINNQSKSNNLNGFVSVGKLPIGGRMSLNYNYNTSAYLKSQIFSFRYSRPLLQNKLNLDFYYRNVDYTYLASEVQINQHYIGTGLSYRLSKKWMFNILGELSTKSKEESYRLNTKIIKRFGK